MHSASDPFEERLTAFTELLSACQAQLLASVFALVQNMADAEDICQRASLVLWRKFDEYQEGTDFRLWALKVAKFEALNFVRKRRHERLFFSEETLLAIADTAMSQRSHAEPQESRWAFLSDCIKRLPATQQTIVRLYYENSRTVADVAKRLGRTEGSTRTALCRIRQALRECIEAKHREEPASWT